MAVFENQLIKLSLWIIIWNREFVAVGELGQESFKYPAAIELDPQGIRRIANWQD